MLPSVAIVSVKSSMTLSKSVMRTASVKPHALLMAVAFTAVGAGRCVAIRTGGCIAAFTAGRAGGCTARRTGRSTAGASVRILRHPVASTIELNRRLLDLRSEIRIEYIQIAAIPGDRVIIDGAAVVLVFLDTGLYRSEITLGDRLIVAAIISRCGTFVRYFLRKSKFRRRLLIPVNLSMQRGHAKYLRD